MVVRNFIIYQQAYLITVNHNKNLSMSQKFQWKPVKTSTQSTSRPCARWGHSSCVISDEIVLFGGYANSIYMNDMWVFDTHKMEWREVKTTGKVPSHRSNCTLNYDHVNHRLVLFGGGGENKKRFNEINLLDWQTKEWTKIQFAENQTAPWERTYHSSELLYPYLITFGGEGISDLDDLWVFSFQTLKWQEVTFHNDAVRPCGRRFHTSCLINNEFFVIAGCYSKYRPLNDVFSIDLTKLKQTGSVEGLQWKQRVLNEQGFLTRWGQSSCASGSNIYIFGGRFSNDLNDLLVIDTLKNKIKVLKVSAENTPKPRRRSCLNFIGNCLLMFGGFNSDYYNDLHYINVTETRPKPKLSDSQRRQEDIENFQIKDQFSDVQIMSQQGVIKHCHSGILMQSFSSKLKFQQFLRQVQGKESNKDLQQLLQCLYCGYGSAKLLHKYFIDLPSSAQQIESQFLQRIQKHQNKKASQSLLTMSDNEKKPKKFNTIQLNIQEFKHYVIDNEDVLHKDIYLDCKSTIDGSRFAVGLSKMVLVRKSPFFVAMLSRNYRNEGFSMLVPVEDVSKLQIIFNWMITGYLVVPSEMCTIGWMSLYKLADYLSLNALKGQILYQLYPMVNETTFPQLFEFAMEHRLEDLAISCARLQIFKNCREVIGASNQYYLMCSEQNRFEIRQEAMTKSVPSVVSKKNNSSTEDMEEEKENNVEACNH